MKKNIIRYAVALVFVILLLVVIFREEKKELQYDIVILGDSVIGNTWGENNVTSLLEERLGKRVFNGAFGGTTMSHRKEQMWGSASNTEWSMVKLAEAISYNDWTSQKAAMAYADSYKEVNLQALVYFAERMEALTRIDFSKVEILIIEHGTNDYNGGKRVDNPEDLYDVTTFGGALRESLRLLQQAYPELRIVLVSPIYCELGENTELKCYEYRYGEGGVLDEYVELERQIAEEFGVEWVNAYHDSGIWEDNIETYMYDSLHLSEAGNQVLGNFLADYFEANVGK